MKRAGIFAGVFALFFATFATVQADDNAAPAQNQAQDNGLLIDLIIATPRVNTLSELKTTVKLTNNSQDTLQLNTTYIGSQVFFFKLRDDAGRDFKPNVSPPVPIKDDGKIGRISLAPGQSTTFNYTGLPYESLKPGTYQLMFHFAGFALTERDWKGQADSKWVDFTVVPANDKTWTKSKP